MQRGLWACVGIGARNALVASAHAGLAPQVTTTTTIVRLLGFLHRKTKEKHLQIGRRRAKKH